MPVFPQAFWQILPQKQMAYHVIRSSYARQILIHKHFTSRIMVCYHPTVTVSWLVLQANIIWDHSVWSEEKLILKVTTLLSKHFNCTGMWMRVKDASNRQFWAIVIKEFMEAHQSKHHILSSQKIKDDTKLTGIIQNLFLAQSM